MIRNPFALEKMTYDRQTGMVVYRSKFHASLKRNLTRHFLWRTLRAHCVRPISFQMKLSAPARPPVAETPAAPHPRQIRAPCTLLRLVQQPRPGERETLIPIPIPAQHSTLMKHRQTGNQKPTGPGLFKRSTRLTRWYAQNATTPCV